MARPVLPVRDRLLSRYKENNGCWEWTGYTDGRYGLLCVNGKELKAHRVSYTEFCGCIPQGFEVRHLCDNTLCINPEHLELGTHKDNMRDMADRNRAKPGTTKLSREDRQKLIGVGIKEIMTYGYSHGQASRINRGLFK